MPFSDWWDVIIPRLNGMGYEEAPSPDGDGRWRWLLREEPLLRRVFILADSGVDMEQLRRIIKTALSQWRKREQPVRIGIFAAGRIRDLSLLAEIPGVGAIWNLQDKGVRLLYQDGRWDVEDNLVRRRMPINLPRDEGSPEEFASRSESPSGLTKIVLLVYVAVFVGATLLGGSGEPRILLKLGAVDAPRIWLGEYWRLVTSLFYHIGFVHFFFNAFALFLIAPGLRKVLGGWRFLAVYFLAGIWGGLADVIGMPYIVSAGASAATFGLLGAMVHVFIRRPKTVSALFSPALAAMYAVLFVSGFLIKGIGAYGQIAGFIGGFAVLGCTGTNDSDHFPKQSLWRIATAVVTAVLLITALHPPASAWHIPFDKGRTALFERNLDLAVDQLTLSRERCQENPAARDSLAQAYLYRGVQKLYRDDYSGALDDFRQGDALRESWKFHYNMAKAYYRMERPEDAVRELRRAFELNPGNAQIKKDLESLRRQMR